MPERNVVTWNAMITGYCWLKDGNGKNAVNGLCLFKEMLLMVGGSEVRPNDTTLVCLLSAASQLGMMEIGVCLHGFAVKMLCKVEDDVFIGTGLVDMYSKCGCLESALYVFWRMKFRNVLTWTAMTTGLAIHGRGEEALEILYKMESDGVRPNETTFTSLLSACCHAGLVEEGLQLFRDMEQKFGVVPRIQHYGCVVDLLGKNGNLNEAYDFILAMPISPDAVIWRSLLSACKIHGDVVMGEKVGRFLLQFKEHSYAELAHKSEDYVALSNVYASAERWNDVETVRKKMKAKGIFNQSGLSSVQTLSNDTFIYNIEFLCNLEWIKVFQVMCRDVTARYAKWWKESVLDRNNFVKKIVRTKREVDDLHADVPNENSVRNCLISDENIDVNGIKEARVKLSETQGENRRYALRSKVSLSNKGSVVQHDLQFHSDNAAHAKAKRPVEDTDDDVLIFLKDKYLKNQEELTRLAKQQDEILRLMALREKSRAAP
ncbi:pentatricopeptide repeat-containing protein at3g18970-like protein [Trifolium pratense]|uniref:Pentatricopeptide repeat-containing protein at3g18970-like protein n=1 Tax=Trifolium pratense TaxID=57577 RepID=A0A2K3NGM6_TRIPR|nr:pentatricopeptide repeat-containing protein at3g18970-like protein [Trifolium pratense]